MKYTFARCTVLIALAAGCATPPVMGSRPAATPGSSQAQNTSPSDNQSEKLGTAFGEQHESTVNVDQFDRDTHSQPISVASIYYYGPQEAESIMKQQSVREEPTPSASLLDGMLTVRVVNENNQPFPGFKTSDRTCVIGKADERYIIIIENHTGYRFEAVGSVDGLDVLDGKTASFLKRGYIIAPYETMSIDGFRTSLSTVAAFRFSSVKGSYSSRAGQGESNVGVIGIALFNEKGVTPSWNSPEAQKTPQAFPNSPNSGFAQPPPQ